MYVLCNIYIYIYVLCISISTYIYIYTYTYIYIYIYICTYVCIYIYIYIYINGVSTIARLDHPVPSGPQEIGICRGAMFHLVGFPYQQISKTTQL